MHKKGKIIFILLLCLSAVYLVVYVVANYQDTSTLSADIKEKIRIEYYERNYVDPDHCENCPVIWYDENGGVEEENVWRYIGTYGHCIALLRIDDGLNAIDKPEVMPFPIYGLSRTVYYHAEAYLYFYNLKDTTGFVLSPEHHLADPADLEFLGLKWMSNAQLEQLTQDIERISKAHN